MTLDDSAEDSKLLCSAGGLTLFATSNVESHYSIAYYNLKVFAHQNKWRETERAYVLDRQFDE